MRSFDRAQQAILPRAGAASTQFQRGKCKKCKYQCANPEAHDHLRLRPAHQLEMVVQRSHLEDPLLPQLIAAHLQDDRNPFDHEDATDKRQQQFLLDHHRYGRNGAPQRQRTHVTHEDLRRVRVIPEETDTRAHHRSTEDGHFADHRHAVEPQVVGEDNVAADVGKHGKRGGGNDGAADRQAIQAVSQVHRVARKNNHQRHEDDEGQKRQQPQVGYPAEFRDREIRPVALEKRDHQVSRIVCLLLHCDQCNGNRHADQYLQTHLLTRRQAQVAPPRHLHVIIGEPNGAEGNCRAHHQPDERIGQIAP